jgi:hypothetical protein
LEHLEKPVAAVQGFHAVLRPGGYALVLVPAHMWLFSSSDTALKHHLRYSKRGISDLLISAGFELEICREFNRLGVLGWYTNKLLGRTTITRFQARLFGLLLPLARVLERITPLPGLSVVAIARKP